MRWMTLTALLAAVALTGCSDFVDQAREDGLTVTDPAGAHFTVDRICSNMDKGARSPVDVLTSLPGGGTTNELELARLGVAEKCPEHNDVYAGVLKVVEDVLNYPNTLEYQRSMDEALKPFQPESNPDLNVGPDGYCLATPCGANGKIPGGYQP